MRNRIIKKHPNKNQNYEKEPQNSLTGKRKTQSYKKQIHNFQIMLKTGVLRITSYQYTKISKRS